MDSELKCEWTRAKFARYRTYVTLWNEYGTWYRYDTTRCRRGPT